MGALITRFKELFAGKNLEIVFVGLENAGKSTLASKLSLEKSFDKGPTYGVDIKTFKKNNVSVKIWDLGGQGNANKCSIVPSGPSMLWAATPLSFS